MRNLDFTSWQALLSTLLGLSVITLIGVGIRLLASFTGDLAVDPSHLKDLKRDADSATEHGIEGSADRVRLGSDRSRRIRDAVEASLSDIILLGTEEQVRLAAAAAAELAAGRPVETAALVVCLRDFIRQVLDLQPVPSQLLIPKQGPSRVMPSKGGKEGEKNSAKQSGDIGQVGGAGGAGLDGGFSRGEGTEHHD